jgi:hypothetical protein
MTSHSARNQLVRGGWQYQRCPLIIVWDQSGNFIGVELPKEKWDFRDVPSGELKAACVWEPAWESGALTRDHSLLERLPSSPAIEWLLDLRVYFGRALGDSDFLGGPRMRVSLECRYWLHQKIRDVHDGGRHCWLSHWEVDEPIQVYGDLEPGGERRGREKTTRYKATGYRCSAIAKMGKTFAQIFELYRNVGMIGGDWERLDELERIERQQSLERVIKRDAALVDGILLTLLPSVFPTYPAERGNQKPAIELLVETNFLVSLT